MAKVMPHTDKTGSPHPNSYWRIIEIKINLLTGEGYFIFAGYHSKAARNSGKPPFAIKEPYEVRGDEFLDYYAKQIAGTMNLMQIGYDLAMKRKEPTGVILQPNTPENPEPNPVQESKSFFDGAADDN